MNKKIIGLVGGMGPSASIDVFQKIHDFTVVIDEKDYPEVLLFSSPNKIPDRTKFILGEITENPAYQIFENIKKLKSMGSSIIGIPCNTAHSPIIFDKINDLMKNENIQIPIVNMVESVKHYILSKYQNKKIGILATSGTYQSKLYHSELIDFIYPDKKNIELVHDLIYSKEYGIKYHNNPVKKFVSSKLSELINDFKIAGASAVVLACTELPLASKNIISDIEIINPNDILAFKLLV